MWLVVTHHQPRQDSQPNCLHRLLRLSRVGRVSIRYVWGKGWLCLHRVQRVTQSSYGVHTPLIFCRCLPESSINIRVLSFVLRDIYPDSQNDLCKTCIVVTTRFHCDPDYLSFFSCPASIVVHFRVERFLRPFKSSYSSQG